MLCNTGESKSILVNVNRFAIFKHVVLQYTCFCACAIEDSGRSERSDN